jgi:Na+/melibiose symporter-like transporter
MWITLVAVIYDYYYGVGKYYLYGFLPTTASVPFLRGICARPGKKRTFISLQLIFIPRSQPGCSVALSDHAYIALAVILGGVLTVLTFNCIIPQAMLADVVDYELWRFWGGQGASYYSILYFFDFLLGGVGARPGLIDHLGFSATGLVDMNVGRIAINLTFGLISLLCTLVGLMFIWQMPSCAWRAAIIRKTY